MSGEIEQAVKTICEEKGISMEAVIGTIEAALAAAYRKDFAEKNQNIRVAFDLKTGNSEVFDVKTVVEDQPEEDTSFDTIDVKPDNESDKKEDGENADEDEKKKFNPKTDIELSEAKTIKKDAKIGDEIITKLRIPDAYGRMAAQTAKQVIIQKLREAERDTQYDEFKGREHEVVMGTVQRRDIKNVYVDIGRITAIMPREEQIEREPYRTGDRIKVYILSVAQTNRGPEIIISRSSNKIVEAVFKNEIPEIANGVIEIKSIAREAGLRSKVAVHTDDPNIDPIGSCVGQRGTRVQTVISELGGEKIDIIQYDSDPEVYITHALAPAKPIEIDIDESKKAAVVTVDDDQLSLAIGRAGQNVRLASKLTGWNINIKSSKSGELVDTNHDSVKEENKGDSSEHDKKAESSVNDRIEGNPTALDIDESQKETVSTQKTEANGDEVNVEESEKIIKEKKPTENTEELEPDKKSKSKTFADEQ